MGLLVVIALLVAFDVASLRFGADSREPGDWQVLPAERR